MGKASQSIGPISFMPFSLGVGGTTTASATGGASGNPVTFTSSSPNSVCTVSSGGLVTAVDVGTCVAIANQAGNATYADAAPVTGSIVVINKGSQTIGPISFTPFGLSVGGTTTVSATASSGRAVNFGSSVTPTICSVSGKVVTGLSTGTCSITASQAGDANYLPATPVTGNITVKIGQTIGPISFAPSTLAVGGTTTAGATTTAGLTVTFASATPGICTMNGGVFTGVAVGTCFITANQAGDGIRAAAPPVLDFITVSQGSQTISAVSFNPATLSIGGTTTASATATSGYAVSFTSSTPIVCTVSGTNGGVVTGVTTGTCAITASQDGKQGVLQNYNAVTSAPQSISVTGLVVSFNPTSLSFVEQHIGSTSADQTVVLTNTGAIPLTISSIGVTVNPNDYVVSGCGSSLAASASCNLSVSFKPTLAGTRIATLKVNGNNAVDSPQVNLTGIGVVSNVPICTLTTTPPRVAPGKSSTLTASCSPTPTSYTWTGVGCTGNPTATCTVTPGATTSYGVRATNAQGSSNAVSATVTVKTVNLTPILMLLLD
jgi:hypothetical protein